MPSGWIETALGAVCEVIQGQSPPGASYNLEGDGVPFFQGKAEFGTLNPRVKKWTTDPRKMARPGDILLSIRAPVGPTNVAAEACAIGRGLAAVRSGSAVDPNYLLWALRGTENELTRRGSGSTFNAVSGSAVREHKIPLPPLGEQRRIVEAIDAMFSKLNAGVAYMEAAHRRLRRLRAGMVALAVSGELLASSGGRTDRSDTIRPKHWRVHRLSEVTVSQDYGTSAKTTAEVTDSGDVPVLRMGNIQNGRIDATDLKYLPANHSDFPAKLLAPGDLLFNRTNSPDLVGKTAVYEGTPRVAAFASYLIRLRLIEVVSPAWVALYINSLEGRSYMASVRTQQVGQANVNGTKLASMPIPIPPRAEQEQLLDQISRVDSFLDVWEHSISEQLARAAALRRSVLGAALAGQLVAQDVEEAAKDLLAQVASPFRTARSQRTLLPRRLDDATAAR